MECNYWNAEMEMECIYLCPNDGGLYLPKVLKIGIKCIYFTDKMVVCNWLLDVFSQVFLPQPQYMLLLGGIWCVCDSDILWDIMFYSIPFDFTWILRYVWATFSIWEAENCRSFITLILDPYRLQGRSSAIYGKFCFSFMLVLEIYCQYNILLLILLIENPTSTSLTCSVVIL